MWISLELENAFAQRLEWYNCESIWSRAQPIGGRSPPKLHSLVDGPGPDQHLALLKICCRDPESLALLNGRNAWPQEQPSGAVQAATMLSERPSAASSPNTQWVIAATTIDPAPLWISVAQNRCTADTRARM